MIKLSSANYKRSYLRNCNLPPLSKTRKLHIIAAKKSKIIISAETSLGTVHDNNYFKILLEKAIKLGFKIKSLLADSGYNSKDNYALCENYGIKEAYIDFKKNHVVNRSKSFLRKRQLILYLKHPDIWHESYNSRVIIETIFSAIKRKGKNYIRSRNLVCQDTEMLLRILWYNLTIIAKHYR